MATKTNWVSFVVDDEMQKLIDREHARRIRTRKPNQRKISKSDVIRDALMAYLRPESDPAK